MVTRVARMIALIGLVTRAIALSGRLVGRVSRAIGRAMRKIGRAVRKTVWAMQMQTVERVSQMFGRAVRSVRSGLLVRCCVIWWNRWSGASWLGLPCCHGSRQVVMAACVVFARARSVALSARTGRKKQAS